MVSKVSRQGNLVLQGAFVSFLALLAFVVGMPQFAFADGTYQTIDGTMTITLQNGASGGGAGGAGTSTVVTTSTAASGGVSSSVLTGDTLIWLILGIVVLLAGAVYVIVKSRKFAGMNVPAESTVTGASSGISVTETSTDVRASIVAGTTADASADSSVENPTSAKRKTIIVAIVATLVACACFGMFANKSNAFAKESLEGVVGISNVVVDEQGNIISNDLAINNNSGQAIFINSVQAPGELTGWNASIKDETVESGSSVKGTWDGKTIPASLLEQVKSNSSSSIELALKININKVLDFDTFSFDTEGATYNGGQITPSVTSSAYQQGTDYEVTYGENKNAGEGTITVKGIGDYKGEKTFTFTIAPKEVSLSWSGDALTYSGQPQAPTAVAGDLVEGDTANVTVGGAQTNAGTYEAIATKIDNANYKLPDNPTQSFTIAQREVSLTWSGDTFTYDKTDHAPTAVAGNLVEGDTANVTVEGTQTDAGTYTATATGLDNENYKLPSANVKEFTITKAEITVSGITANNKTYDGTTKAVFSYDGVNLKGKVDGDTLSVSAEGAFEYANAGVDKKVVITKLVLQGDSVGNYELASTGQQTTATATIDQAELDFDLITISTGGATYTGAQIKPAVTSYTYKEDLDFEVTYGENVNAGEKTGSVTVKGVDNYKGEETTTFDIAKADPKYDIPQGLTAEVGQKLSDVILPKQTTPTKGTFTWSNPDTTINEGDKHFLATFTPDDQDNYNVVYNIKIPVTVTTTKTTFAVYFADESLGFYNRVESEIPSVGAPFDGKTVSDVYRNIENADYQPGWLGNSIKEATVKDAGIRPASTANWFALNDTSKLTTVDVSKLETQNTTNMSSMFKGCSALTTVGDISSWDTAQVTDMSSMFKDCKALTTVGDVSAWNENTVNVTNMTSMFENCVNLEANCSGWNVDKVGDNQHENFDANAPGVQSPWDSHLDFDYFTVNTDSQIYTANQITPSVASDIYRLNTDYEVVYGENKNAGQGTITIKGLNKYKDEQTYTFTIDPKELTLNWSEQVTFAYDGTAHLPSASIDGTLGSDQVNLTVKGEQTNAGVYNAVAKIDNTNYKLPSVDEKEFTITRAGITVSGITANNKEYDGSTSAELNFDNVTLTGKVGTDDLSVVADGAFENANAGADKTVIVSNLVLGGTSVDNYKLAETGQQTATTATIAQASFDFGKLSVDTEEKVYTAKQITPAVTSDDYNHGIDYEVTYGENKNFGMGTIAVRAIGNYEGEKTYSFAIEQKELTLTWGSQTVFTYDGKSHIPSAKIGGIAEGDTVVLSVEGKQTEASDTIYVATASIDNTNYRLPTESFKEFTIKRAPITVSGITANNKTYDGTAEAKLNFENVKLQGKIDDDDLTISAEGAFENASAGKDKTVNIFKLTLGGESVGNYELADSEQQTTTKATINYASIDLGKITILSEGATYTGQQIKPAVKSDAYVQDSDFEVTYGENINAGEKAGSVIITGIGNYTGEQTVTFDIAKANPGYEIPENITAEVGQKLSEVVLPKQTTPVKGTFTWDNSDATVAEGDTSFKATFTPEDQVNYNDIKGINVPVTVTATKTAFAVYFIDGSLGFYNRIKAQVPSKEGELFDGKFVVKVYPDIETRDYTNGAPWKDETITSATVVDAGIQPKSTANWFALNDASTLTKVDVSKLETANTTNFASMFEGCNALTTIGDISGWNTAQVTDMSSMFKDCKALTTVGNISAWNKNTASVTNMTSMFENCENLEADCSGWTVDNVGTNHENFDTNAPGVQSPWDKHIDFNKFTVDTEAKTYTANQITPRVTSDTYTEGTDYEVAYGENKNAGQGTITIKSLNKYKDEKTYTFTIEPKELTLTWNKETTFTYDGKSHYPGANVSGAVGGDTVSVKVKGEQTNAGTYTAIARIENTNYKLPDDATRSFTIESRPVTLSWSGDSFTYNSQAQAPTATAGNLVEGDTVSVTVEGAQVNAGTGYIATATALSDTNYKLPDKHTYTFAIEKADVVISGITAKDKIYDGTTDATLDCSQAIFADKFEGDELSVSAQGSFEDANAGVAKQVNISNFVLSGTSKDNYKPAERGQQTTTSATITPATIDSKEITISDEGTTYTGDQLTPEVTVEGLKQGSDFTVEYGENINAGKDAGSATITGTGNYTGTQTKTFDIAKADPAYLIPLTLSAETDQTLEDIAIPKQTIPVAGTFTWESPTTHTDKIGSYTYKATFTPDDMKNYNKVEGIKIPVKVTQAKIAFAAYFSEDKSLNFYNRFEVPNVGDELDGKTISEIYTGFETAKYDFDGAPWRNKAIASVDVVDDGISPVSTVGWFYLSDKAVLTTADLSKLDTSKVTDMSYMFYWSAALTSVGDLSSWNTSNVTDMSHMFYRCHSIGSIGNVLGWDTSNVTDMEAMFFICGNLTLDCSKWNVKKVGNNHNLFRMYAPKIISPWDSVPLKIENFNLDTSGKVYTGEQIKPSVTSDYYKEGSDYTVSYGENINAGTGTITISSKGHCTGTLTVDFDIAKADPTYSAPQWCMAEECQTLADIALPEQTGQTEQTKGKFVWDVEDPSLVSVGNAGETSTFKAKFVPEDTKNYNTISNIEISISVIKVSKTAFAVYFAEDGSLNFYKRATAPKAGDTFDGKTVSAVFKDIETNTYSSGNTPWIAQKDNITNVKTVDSNIQPVSTAYWFSDLSSLTSANMTLLNTSNVTNMDYMFANCSSLTSVKGALGFDTVKVTNMNSVFYNCSNLTLDVSGWNIEKVGDAHECFKENAPNVKSPWEIEESFAVYSATDNSLNFYKRIRLEIPVAGATFDGKIATEVYKDIEKNTYSYDTLPWNQHRREITSVEVVDDGIAPVSTAHWFNDFKQVDSLNISKLITSNTVNMSHMFNSVKLSTLDLSNFDTSCAKNMTCMFYNCTNLSSVEGLESWDTSKVENMALQFYNCYALSADCSVWNVLNVGKNLHANFNQNAPNVKSPWDVGISFAVYSADDSSLSFYKRTSTPSVGDQFENKTVTEIYWNGETVTYDNEAVPWATKRSAITSVKVADTGIAPVSTAYWFYGCSQLASVDVSNLDTSKVTNMECMFAETGVTTLDLSTFNTSKVQNMNSMFSDCTKLVSIEGVSDWNTHSATNMSYMFCNCSALSADCTNWNVGKVEENNHQGFNDNTYKVKAPWGDFTFAIASYDDYSLTFYKDSEIPKSGSTYRGKTATTVYSNVELTTEEIIPWRFWGSGIKTIEIADKGISPTNMESWFNGFNKVTEIKGLSKLDTSKVVSMKSTFQDCSSLLKADVSLWDTSNVTDMSYMFSGSGVTYLDLSNFDVRNVKDMSYMFSESAIQSVPDIANWSPNQVENMSFMFYKCTNLSMFNGMSQANSLRTAKSMFQGCTNLTEVHISNLGALQATDLSSMFASCNNLVTFDGSDLVGSSVTNTSNMFNSCTKLESIEGADAHLAPCWVTSGLQDVSYMFYRCESLNLDCTAWDVGNVVNHEGFKGNASGVISPWDL